MILLIGVVVLSWGYMIATESNLSGKNIKFEWLILVGIGLLAGTHAILSVKRKYFIGYSSLFGGKYIFEKDKNPIKYYASICICLGIAVLFAVFPTLVTLHII